MPGKDMRDVGPPPPARGAHVQHASGDACLGTTPACAGSTANFTVASTPRVGPPPPARGARQRVDGKPPWTGPPPPARGAPTHLVQVPAPAGTTPACAGSTPPPPLPAAPRWDHPRLRGEHYGDPPGWDKNAGTTPACAGSTWAGSRWTSAGRDHPRLRGEHPVSSAPAVSTRGPPPPARGARRPARPSGSPSRDHPRLRGEHFVQTSVAERGPGPPPPARGALRRRRPRSPRRPGTTPACAGSTSGWARWGPGPRDHPRLRGEHPNRASAASTPMGPPPPARGAPDRHGQQPVARGTTPACAGSTRRGHGRVGGARDHPRLREEHPNTAHSRRRSWGPPPPARGARLGADRAAVREGTTPACAGSTCPAHRSGSRTRDHPRLRGEHVLRAHQLHGRGGTTPACAGSTARPRRCAACCRDHPRLRGEHRPPGALVKGGIGPPPPARGAPPEAHARHLAPRTTPACAGSPRSRRRPGRSARDHPRLRGEHPRPGEPGPQRAGPPPPARGARPDRAAAADRGGTTPACAGSTPAGTRSGRRRWDHPRLRGEHRVSAPVAGQAAGPPPPARGARAQGDPQGPPDGTTPACAGSTRGSPGTPPT